MYIYKLAARLWQSSEPEMTARKKILLGLTLTTLILASKQYLASSKRRLCKHRHQFPLTQRQLGKSEL